MEVLDVIDENDRVIGQASRTDCHTDPTLIHRAVHFTLVDLANRLVMISRRARSKKHDGGLLCFLGEHVNAGEDYEAAVRRGAKEELEFTASTVHEAGEHVFAEPTSTERVKFYLIEADHAQPLTWDKDEIEEIEWVTPEQLGTFAVSAMTEFWREHIDWRELLDSPPAT